MKLHRVMALERKSVQSKGEDRPPYIEDLKGIKLPSAFEEINLGSDQDVPGRRAIMQKYNKRLVLVKEEHSGRYYRAGRLEFDPNDDQCFHLDRTEFNHERERIWYNDLQGLLVPVL